MGGLVYIHPAPGPVYIQHSTAPLQGPARPSRLLSDSWFILLVLPSFLGLVGPLVRVVIVERPDDVRPCLAQPSVLGDAPLLIAGYDLKSLGREAGYLVTLNG